MRLVGNGVEGIRQSTLGLHKAIDKSDIIQTLKLCTLRQGDTKESG